jgi:hypothetical protein
VTVPYGRGKSGGVALVLILHHAAAIKPRRATGLSGGAFVRGRSAGLWLLDGNMWTPRGGVFD